MRHEHFRDGQIVFASRWSGWQRDGCASGGSIHPRMDVGRDSGWADVWYRLLSRVDSPRYRQTRQESEYAGLAGGDDPWNHFFRTADCRSFVLRFVQLAF